MMGRVALTAIRFYCDVLLQVPIGKVKPDERRLVRQGDALPVDGRVARNAVAVILNSVRASR